MNATSQLTAPTTSTAAISTTDATRLLDSLRSQRDHVVGILDGLEESAARRAVAPSGWDVRGLIRHLTHDDERFWFSAVIAGDPEAIEAAMAGGNAWDVAAETDLSEVLAHYRAEALRSDAVLAQADLDAPPAWWPAEFFGEWRLSDVRQVVLHVITETATHAGHLDLVRELVDRRQWIVL